MSAYTIVSLLLSAVVLAAPRASGQGRDSATTTAPDSGRSTLACPRSGSALRAWVGGDDAGRVGMRADSVTVAPVPLRSALDTVVTLDIANRTWQRDALAVGVSLGVAGTAGTRRAPWHACAGATATLGRVTATLRNVHGQIHLRADARALEAIGRSAGTTPPAPPRR